ncbi:hypothetical protein CF386_10200 [Paraphotobacterium marinum]|uniref:YokE-like PH domain-containing protein n=1 Tax=Paraphotobacterium marinum TaxID=1755811 RepID=A0A220VGX1_9GAMM|nr:PH domain-containing protein [Paraphotobacterium marinum]ASK79422.1 hypothetical protein CF386_10200 [Paraphotobacterium marinum]
MFNYKNASKQELKEQFKRIAKSQGERNFIISNEKYYLPKVLNENEEILSFITGRMNDTKWLITLTNQRIILIDKGLLYGLKQITIDLKHISSISSTTDLTSGKIQINQENNNYLIEHISKKLVVYFVKKANEVLQTIHLGGSSLKNSSDESTENKLVELIELREKGLINETEFAKAKAKVLNIE